MAEEFGAENWESYATLYDALNELNPYREMQIAILEATNFQYGQKVLDAACGSGNLAYWAEKTASLNGAFLIGADFSEEMLERAKTKCGHIYEKIVRTDLNKLIPFADATFDKAVCTLTLYALDNPASFLLEISRVLKDSGTLTLVTPKAGYENGLILKAHCRDKGPDEFWLDAHASPEREKELVSRAIPDEELARKIMAIAEHNRSIKNASFYFPKQEELLRLLSECGFSVLSCKKTYAGQDYLILAENRRKQ